MEQEHHERMVGLLSDIADEVHQTDDDLEIDVTEHPELGMTVGFLNASFSTPRFIVKVKETQSDLQISALDGHWQESPNQHGLWGDWMDEKILFTGTFEASRIQQAVEQAFQIWYQRVKHNGESGITLH